MSTKEYLFGTIILVETRVLTSSYVNIVVIYRYGHLLTQEGSSMRSQTIETYADIGTWIKSQCPATCRTLHCLHVERSFRRLCNFCCRMTKHETCMHRCAHGRTHLHKCQQVTWKMQRGWCSKNTMENNKPRRKIKVLQPRRTCNERFYDHARVLEIFVAKLPTKHSLVTSERAICRQRKFSWQF